tara:strand:+ start:41 stop:931 length:891 start_codon:yes stop_codon:yes gene_type:complete
MKHIFFILFSLFFLGINAQNSDFLTQLFLGESSIQNQTFKLKIVGVVNPEAQKNYSYDSYYNRSSSSNFSEILFNKDIRTSLQSKSEVYLGSYELNPDFVKQCSWNWSKDGDNEKYNPNLNMVKIDTLDVFPKFSFLKGKLLTILDGPTNKDFLFSVTKTTEHEDYGNNSMYFNLTDDNEKGYKIRTIIIENKCYIILSYSEMETLGFQVDFASKSGGADVKFKVLCDPYSEGSSYDRTSYLKSASRYSSYLKNCKCSCDDDYINIWKRKVHYMNKDLGLNEDKLFYLFELVETYE